MASPIPPPLLNLIKAYPTEAAVRDLLIHYMDAAKDNPSRAYALTSVLVAPQTHPHSGRLPHSG